VRSLLLSPRWLVRHAVAIVLVGVCLRLGWWQWDRARSVGGTAQNLGYALQWPAFGAFVIYAWIRMFRLELHPPAAPDEPPAAPAETPRPTVQVRRHYKPATDAIPTAPSADEPSDEQLAAYNEYLADLNQPRRTSS
jgi:hypothetical protein